MKIKHLKLFTHRLEEERAFYADVIGFTVMEESSVSFTLEVGESLLSFIKSEQEHKYHYCFLIPSNKLKEAVKWLEERTEVPETEPGCKTAVFETWNAESVYFFDKSGNIAEFIVRHDLKNESDSAFDIKQILSLSEIGMPTRKVAEMNSILEEKLQSSLWRGDLERFGVNGTQKGLFLLPNYEVKKTWFPTDLEVRPEPFETIIENKGVNYSVIYRAEKLSVVPLK